MIKHLDLFSGIGGFALALDWAADNVDHTFCEIDPFCQKVLKKHWPNSIIHDDIKTFKADDIGPVDILTGGFPCQPFSSAGKQRAQADNRHLWPEMFRVIKECRPSWIVGENVTGIINLALEEVCVDLESEGYEVWPLIIPACAVNAPHRRDRVWIIANANSHPNQQQEKSFRTQKQGIIIQEPKTRIKHTQLFDNGLDSFSRPTSDTNGQRLEGRKEDTKGRQRIECQKQFARFCDNNDWQHLPKPGISRGDDGFSQRMDRNKSLGNGIVPLVAYQIFKHLTTKV